MKSYIHMEGIDACDVFRRCLVGLLCFLAVGIATIGADGGSESATECISKSSAIVSSSGICSDAKGSRRAYKYEIRSDGEHGTITPIDFLLVTVASNRTEGYRRFIRSAKYYNVPVKVLGMGEKWLGGNMNSVGGGYKVNLFLKELKKYKDNKEKIVMFTDRYSYDVVLTAGPDRIIEQFENFGARVLFSAERSCWPDESLASQYPTVSRGKRFLNSGGLIGYANDLYAVVSSSQLKDSDDDQLFYTKVYLNTELREKHKIQLDHKSEIFQNLNGAILEVELRFRGKEAYLQNTAYGTVPSVIHGNGPSKLIFNTLGNYLANAWNPQDGCVACLEDTLHLSDSNLKEGNYPTVLFAIFIEQATPFLEEFFHKLERQEYPKKRIHIFIHNSEEYHAKDVKKFVDEVEDEYASIKQIIPDDNIKEWHARNLAINHCSTINCDYFFNVDAVAHVDNPSTLINLIEQNRSVVGPMLTRPQKAWSNFWGALTADGFYARSMDYMEIVQNERRGLWNIPYISACYLINGTVIKNEETKPSYIRNLMDADMAFCQNMREKNIFMYVSNRLDYGHLINADNFDTSHLHNDLYQIFDNRWDWEQRYIHENYTENFNPNKTIAQPCPDVYWFPVITPRFCRELIEEMEHFGKWSDGSNQDERIEGGYEQVPTRDIHMNQIGMEKQWDHFLMEIVRPLQRRVYDGYTQPPRSLMNFVVRYKPDEQPFLRPHHDSSTYTINIALNTAKVDYEGGGCNFLRYNCSVVDTKLGWMLMHPGRLTHYHEGLPVTKGTRYIMISFVDP
ncbi:procollagen-lysine,2-oxoglutarate 5-dioxygenase 1 isoform X2 [Ischnura elegans]|uniref:procollagen-lysine,2-oxoglutarate 5-dioxygenase 1 isoform X2 n=1 Tax=Ischnura elegans TaxID=197161 RepID=UPI001ED88C71|nr:procollagen-lysine,2-oxoglutarate 5-dioxygenase 1 isoform X2 [Ischnura elegans]